MVDLGEGWDYPTLNHPFRLLMSHLQPRLIGLGMTRYWKAPDGLRVDVAPFVAALEHAAGVQPVVPGKPSAALAFILQRLSLNSSSSVRKSFPCIRSVPARSRKAPGTLGFRTWVEVRHPPLMRRLGGTGLFPLILSQEALNRPVRRPICREALAAD